MPRQRYRVTIARKRRTHLTGADGWEVRVNGVSVGDILPILSHKTFPPKPTGGWYMAVCDEHLGIPFWNTAGELGVPEEDVKRAAVRYVKERLACSTSTKEIGRS